MRWIRTATDMIDDKSIGRIARMCGIERPHALGHVVCILHKMPGQAIDGNLADVDDEDLEDWAMWSGEPGRFAAAFRAQMCDDAATVKAWEKHNGAAIREYLRKHDRSTPGKKSPTPEPSAPLPAKSGAEKIAESVPSQPKPARLRDETRRDVTHNKQQQLLALVADAPTPLVDDVPGDIPEPPPPKRARPKRPDDQPAKYPHFPSSVCHDAWRVWCVDAGDVDFGRFRATFAGYFREPEEKRDPKQLRDAEFAPLVQLYVDATVGTTEVSYGSVARCAERLSRLVPLLRRGGDRTGLTDGARLLLGFKTTKVG